MFILERTFYCFVVTSGPAIRYYTKSPSYICLTFWYNAAIRSILNGLNALLPDTIIEFPLQCSFQRKGAKIFRKERKELERCFTLRPLRDLCEPCV